MEFTKVLVVASEVLIPVLAALLARNNVVTNHSYVEIKELKRILAQERLVQEEWKIKVSTLLARNDRITERNSKLIEQLINNSCIGAIKNET